MHIHGIYTKHGNHRTHEKQPELHHVGQNVQTTLLFLSLFVPSLLWFTLTFMSIYITLYILSSGNWSLYNIIQHSNIILHCYIHYNVIVMISNKSIMIIYKYDHKFKQQANNININNRKARRCRTIISIVTMLYKYNIYSCMCTINYTRTDRTISNTEWYTNILLK